MIASAPRRHRMRGIMALAAHRRRGFVILAATAALLAGCGGERKVAAGNDVEMRDMDVVDGTINDSMTDLDAVQADSVGLANEAGSGEGRAARPRIANEAAGEDDEAVTPE